MDVPALSIIGAVVAVSFGAIGPAFAEGRAVAAAMEGIARQPEAAGTLSRTLFVGLAMIE
ncbi:MAG: F0F1 ATP synthase subunit C, partial [Myxococcales bacterium]|nr:F0F1 ATP synthase subunit C [Myxococcales bacterium]